MGALALSLFTLLGPAHATCSLTTDPESGAYLIASVSDLEAVGTVGCRAPDAVFEFAVDELDLASLDAPLDSFEGTLSGGAEGVTLKNLTISATDSAGLFESAVGDVAVVRGLVFENPTLSVNLGATPTPGTPGYGILFGRTQLSSGLSVSDVTVRGAMVSLTSTVNNDYNLGGIVGRVGTGGSATFSSITVEDSNFSSNYGESNIYFGGVAGRTEPASVFEDIVVADDVTFTDSIDGTEDGRLKAGGVVGSAAGSQQIRRVYSGVRITSPRGDAALGGVVGETVAVSVTDTTFEGHLSATDDNDFTFATVSGVVGTVGNGLSLRDANVGGSLVGSGAVGVAPYGANSAGRSNFTVSVTNSFVTPDFSATDGAVACLETTADLASRGPHCFVADSLEASFYRDVVSGFGAIEEWYGLSALVSVTDAQASDPDTFRNSGWSVFDGPGNALENDETWFMDGGFPTLSWTVERLTPDEPAPGPGQGEPGDSEEGEPGDTEEPRIGPTVELIGSPLQENVPFDLTVAITDASGTDLALTDVGSVVAYVDGAAEGAGLRSANLDPRADGGGGGRVALDVDAGDSSFTFEDLVFTGSASSEAPIRIVVSGTDGSLASAATSTTDLTVSATTFAVESAAETLFADGTETTVVTASFADAASGDGVAGVDVRFATTAGTLLTGDEGDRTVVGSSHTVVTDASGVAQVVLRSGTAEGTATVTASCPGVCTESVDVAFTPGLAGVSVDPDADGAWVTFDPLPDSVTGLQVKISPSDVWTDVSTTDLAPPVRISGPAFASGEPVSFEVRPVVGETPLASKGPFTVTPAAPEKPDVALREGSDPEVIDVDYSQPGETRVKFKQELTFGEGGAPERLFLIPQSFATAAVQAVGAAQSANVEIVIVESSTGTVLELEDRGIWVWEDIETDDAGTADLSVQVRVVEVE